VRLATAINSLRGDIAIAGIMASLIAAVDKIPQRTTGNSGRFPFFILSLRSAAQYEKIPEEPK
jgi:hypothetical protein